MGLETATYISGLNANNPVDATDLVNQGDDHLRLVKSTLLNTFPNITGAMTLTHTQLNNAAIANASTNFSITTATDLVDNDNALNIGALAGVHLAFDPTSIQAKSDAATAADLLLNRLGGDVEIYGDATKIVDRAASNPQLQLLSSAAAELGRVAVDGGDLEVDNRASAIVRLRGWDGVSAYNNILEGSATGALTLSHAGSGFLVSQADGVQIRDTSGSDVRVELADDAGTVNGDLRQTATRTYLRGLANGTDIYLEGRDTGGTLRTLATFDPDAGFGLYRAGALNFTSVADGQVAIRPASGTITRMFMQDSGGTNYAQFVASSSELTIRGPSSGEVRLQRNAADTVLLSRSDGGISQYFSNVEQTRTQDNDASTNTTGLQIKHHDGTLYDAGLMPAPVLGITSTTIVDDVHAGKTMRLTSTGNLTVSVTTNNIGNGTPVLVINQSGSNRTINQSGVTLTWMDGAGSTTGTRTLANGGIATIMKRATGQFLIWGVGLS